MVDGQNIPRHITVRGPVGVGVSQEPGGTTAGISETEDWHQIPLD